MGNCEVSLAERYTNTFSYYSITDQQVKSFKEKMQNSCYGGMAVNNIILKHVFHCITPNAAQECNIKCRH